MTELQIVEWKRYGKHRGYVKRPDGTRLGWVDVATGEMHLEADADTAAFTALTHFRSTSAARLTVVTQIGEARLADLERAGWRAVHDIPVGTGHVDHLLIGPGGVFSIITVDLARAEVRVDEHALTVNGEETEHLADARLAARHVTDVLTGATPWRVPVRPVLIIDAASLAVTSAPVDVHVIRSAEVTGHFEGIPALYSAEAIDWIYDEAREPTTWE